MYLPESFKSDNPEKSISLIEQFPFGLLIACNDNLPEIAHIPFRIKNKQPLILEGHVAIGNPLCRNILNAEQLTAVFSGEHGYISPLYYSSARLVPTWNYAAVHVSGCVQPIDNPVELMRLVEQLTDTFEKQREDPWVPDYNSAMLSQILGFRLFVDKIEGKFKLSQNRSAKDQQSLLKALDQGSDAEVALAERMRKEC